MADRPGTNPLALCDIVVDVAHGRSEQDTTQQDDDIESHLSNPFSIIDKPLIKVINITTVLEVCKRKAASDSSKKSNKRKSPKVIESMMDSLN